MINKKWLPLLMAGLALAILASGGCIFSPDGGGDDNTPVPDPYPWPSTPDILMNNFERAYGEMNIDEYRNIIHEDYKFIFIDDGETWYRDDDLQSTQHMFAGNDGQNPDVSLRDGVQSISMNSLIRDTAWENIPGNDPDFPDSKRALFQVNIVFTLNGGDNTITVRSNQEFFVKAEEIDQGDGTTRTRYFLYGQRDMIAS